MCFQPVGGRRLGDADLYLPYIRASERSTRHPAPPHRRRPLLTPRPTPPLRRKTHTTSPASARRRAHLDVPPTRPHPMHLTVTDGCLLDQPRAWLREGENLLYGSARAAIDRSAARASRRTHGEIRVTIASRTSRSAVDLPDEVSTHDYTSRAAGALAHGWVGVGRSIGRPAPFDPRDLFLDRSDTRPVGSFWRIFGGETRRRLRGTGIFGWLASFWRTTRSCTSRRLFILNWNVSCIAFERDTITLNKLLLIKRTITLNNLGPFCCRQRVGRSIGLTFLWCGRSGSIILGLYIILKIFSAKQGTQWHTNHMYATRFLWSPFSLEFWRGGK